MSIFNKIKFQLVQNELEGCPSVLELGSFSTNVLRWLEENKVLVIVDKKPKRIQVGESKYVYHIRYTALNPDNSFFRGTKIHKDTEAELKDDRLNRGYYSQTDGEQAYYENKELYEKIAFEDMTCSDRIAFEAGMDLYQYLEACERSEELRQARDEEVKTFYMECTLPDYVA